MKSIKTICFVLIFTSLITIVILSSTGCSCASCEANEQAEVPFDILAKADSFIVSKTGKEFFDKYITVDFYHTKHSPPYYEMEYQMYIPEAPYANAQIKFTIDSIGNVMMNRDIVGIPKCRYFPQECNFIIDEQQAKQIATEYGLEEGIKEWKTGFLWDYKRERYVWKILTTLSEIKGETVYKAKGKEIIIDPANGEVLALNDWGIY